MKKIIFTVAIAFSLVLLHSCRKDIDMLPDTCKLIQTSVVDFALGGSYDNFYEYDAHGLVNRFGVEMYGFRLDYTIFRDRNNLITHVDDETGGTAKFIYKGQQLSEIHEYIDGEIWQSHWFTYYPDGKLKSAKRETMPMPEYDFPGQVYTNKFEYYPDETLKKSTRYDESGQIKSYYTYTHKGVSSPSAELYLMKHGVPLLIGLYLPYVNYMDHGEGTILEFFSSDGKGGFSTISKIELKSKRLNRDGFTASMDWEPSKGYECDCIEDLNFTYECSPSKHK